MVPGDKGPHYTKMWSWGDKSLFDRKKALAMNPPLAAGRPDKEYHETWSSGFNFAFFQSSTFLPKKCKLLGGCSTSNRIWPEQ